MKRVLLILLALTASAQAETTMPTITVVGRQPIATMTVVPAGDDCPVEEVARAMQGLPNACKPPSWVKASSR